MAVDSVRMKSYLNYDIISVHQPMITRSFFNFSFFTFYYYGKTAEVWVAIK